MGVDQRAPLLPREPKDGIQLFERGPSALCPAAQTAHHHQQQHGDDAEEGDDVWEECLDPQDDAQEEEPMPHNQPATATTAAAPAPSTPAPTAPHTSTNSAADFVALHDAARNGDAAAVQQLLAQGEANLFGGAATPAALTAFVDWGVSNGPAAAAATTPVGAAATTASPAPSTMRTGPPCSWDSQPFIVVWDFCHHTYRRGGADDVGMLSLMLGDLQRALASPACKGFVVVADARDAAKYPDSAPVRRRRLYQMIEALLHKPEYRTTLLKLLDVTPERLEELVVLRFEVATTSADFTVAEWARWGSEQGFWVVIVGDDSDLAAQLCRTPGVLVVKAFLNQRAVGWVPSKLLPLHGLPETAVGQAQLALACACSKTDYGRGVAYLPFRKALALIKETEVFTPAQLVQHPQFRQLLQDGLIQLDCRSLDNSYTRFLAAAVRVQPPTMGSGAPSNSNGNTTNSSSTPQYKMATPLNQLSEKLEGLQLLRADDTPTDTLLRSLSELLSTAAGSQGPAANKQRLEVWLTATDPLDTLPHGEDLRLVAAGAASFVAPFDKYPDLRAHALLTDPVLLDMLTVGNTAGARELLSVSRVEEQADVLVPALNKAYDECGTSFKMSHRCPVLARALDIAAGDSKLQEGYHAAAAITTPISLEGWLVRNHSRLQSVSEFLSRTGWEHQQQTTARRRAALRDALAVTLANVNLKSACSRMLTATNGEVFFLPSDDHLQLVATAASTSSAAAAAAAAAGSPPAGPDAAAPWQLQLADVTAPQLRNLVTGSLPTGSNRQPRSSGLGDFLRQLQPQLHQLHGGVPAPYGAMSARPQSDGTVLRAARAARTSRARDSCLQQLASVQRIAAAYRQGNSSIDAAESLLRWPACGSSLSFSDLPRGLRDDIANANVINTPWQSMMQFVSSVLPGDDSVAQQLQSLLNTLEGSNSPVAAAGAAAVATGPGALGRLLLEQAQQRPPHTTGTTGWLQQQQEEAAGNLDDINKMQKLQRALFKLMPPGTPDLPKNASGDPQFTIQNIKTWMDNTLGEAPRPPWGIPDGMDAYLADLMNCTPDKETGEPGAITPQQAMGCISPPAVCGGEGRAWDIRPAKLMELGLHPWNWEVPLKKAQVSSAPQTRPSPAQPQQRKRRHNRDIRLIEENAAAAAAAGGGGGGGSSGRMVTRQSRSSQQQQQQQQHKRRRRVTVGVTEFESHQQDSAMHQQDKVVRGAGAAAAAGGGGRGGSSVPAQNSIQQEQQRDADDTGVAEDGAGAWGHESHISCTSVASLPSLQIVIDTPEEGEEVEQPPPTRRFGRRHQLPRV